MGTLRFIRNLVAWTVLLLLSPAWAPAAQEPGRTPPGRVVLHYFWGEGCPHCARAKPFLDALARRYPALEIRPYEVFDHQENVDLLMAMARELGEEAKSVPTVIIGRRMIAGFNDDKAAEIEAAVRGLLPSRGEPPPGETGSCPPDGAVTVPLLGRIDPAVTSLPAFTLAIAVLDSFNPCAFFVLLFLLSLLIHTHSRLRMVVIGATFVLFSGLIYFVFMSAWLNIFLMAGTLRAITFAAGIIALVVAAINIKDFFLFEKGVSLSIPEEKKPRLFERMRRLVRADSWVAMLAGTVVLAVAANSYELLCTAGFPMVYTRVLTLHRLPTPTYYLYLILYNLIYVIPLAIIVAIFAVTLGSRKLSQWQGRVLKLLSGVMMLLLGSVILSDPSLLNNPLSSFALLGIALALTLLVAWLWRRIRPEIARDH